MKKFFGGLLLTVTALASLALLMTPVTLASSLVTQLQSQSQHAGMILLDADGNGQTYFLHFKSGRKFYTGQVSRETGQAFADYGAWLGVSRENLSTIPTQGTPHVSEPLSAPQEIPEAYLVPTERVQQGIYGTCVPFSITQAAEYAYWYETGIPIQFSELQFFTEAGGTDLGISIHVANQFVKNTGLIEYHYRPYDPTPWTYEAEYMAPMSIEAERYKFQAHTIAGWYTGTESQVDQVKLGIMEYGPVAFGIDTIKDWDEGAEYPEGREYTANHEALIVGWNDDGWIVRNSYGEDVGLLLFDYPLKWIFGYEVL